MTENKVGITLFMSETTPLRATLKYRMTDFLVEEIDEEKNIIKHNPNFRTELKNTCEKEFEFNLNEKSNKELEKMLEESSKEDFQNFISNPNEFIKKKRAKKFYLEVSEKNKEQRGEVHKLIRENFAGFISRTLKREEKTLIELKFVGKESESDYLYFHLRKRNYDTMRALNKIARTLKKKNGNFYFAGTKDKRGETVQRVVVRNLKAKTLCNIFNMKFWNFDQISFSNIKHVDEPISLGMLYGNRFTIALRLMEKIDEKILKEKINGIKKNGFINYFGEQRFGTKNRFRTHDTGKFLLLKQFKEALFSVLNADDSDKEKDQIINKFENDQNVKDCLKNLDRRRYFIERKLVNGMFRDSKNYLNAFLGLEKVMRNMYIHAYQSFLWNRAVTIRLSNYEKKISFLKSG